MKNLQEFIGHSGCDIKLIRLNKRTVVRKTSSSFDYNHRFNLQIEKQANFSNSIIKVPEIYNTGYTKGLLYCDMEYINGLKLSDFVSNNSFADTLKYFNILLDFIKNNFSNVNYSPEVEIKKKINQILESVIIDVKVIDYLEKKSCITIPTGYCHGDLTFENILVYNNDLYLIDFLDSYIESPVIDISKIYQELILNWSNRMKSDIHFLSSVRNHFLRKYLDRFVEEVINVDKEAINVQTILTLSRILPYTKNEFLYLNISKKILNLI